MPDEVSGASLEGFAERLTQAIAHCKVNQTEFARQLGASSGFISDAVRGHKKPGAEFLFAMRKKFGISIDWLLTGEGTLAGTSGIHLDLLRSIRLKIAVARSAILDENPFAKALLSLIRDDRMQEAAADPGIAQFLDEMAPPDADTDLALALYNGQMWTQDASAQHRNLLAAAIAHFEARKPIDKLASLSGASGTTIQINTGQHQRNAGRDYHEC